MICAEAVAGKSRAESNRTGKVRTGRKGMEQASAEGRRPGRVNEGKRVISTLIGAMIPRIRWGSRLHTESAGPDTPLDPTESPRTAPQNRNPRPFAPGS